MRKICVIMVPGGEVFPKNSLEGTNTANRINTAVALARQKEKEGYEVWLPVSGGLDHPGQTIATGVLMSRFASYGVAGTRIHGLSGVKAMHTYGNVFEFMWLMWKNSIFWGSEKYVVSEYHHCRRIRLSFLNLFLTPVQIHATKDVLSPKKRKVERFHYFIHFWSWLGWGAAMVMEGYRSLQRRLAS